ncbi:MAG: pitrilysin family protein [Myxococcota bacterium]
MTEFSIPYEKYVVAGNGLEVILHQDTSLPIVAVNLWYHAGPINESPGRTGFAHLFEHLMFQGSKHVGDDQHFAMLQAAGASMINGTTGFDRTNYFETVPSNQLELALWLESDRMGFLLETLTEAKLDNQREVVKNERRQSVENQPYGLSAEKVIQTLFPADHPYYGDVIGSMDDLNAATLEDVKAFFQTYYAPANATLVIAGDFDVEAAKELVSKYFGDLPRRAPPTQPHIAEPTMTAEKRVVLEDQVKLPRLQFAWHSAPYFKSGDATADVLAFILGGGKSSRLYRDLVYDQQIAQSVSASQESAALGSVFRIVVTGRPGTSIERLEKQTQAVIDAIKAKPPTEREIQRARNQLLTSNIAQLQRIGGFGGKADLLNRYNQYIGDPGFLSQDLARYTAIKPRHIHKLAQSLLDSNKRAVVITVPKS